MASHPVDKSETSSPRIGKAVFYSLLVHILLIMFAVFSPNLPLSWVGKEKPLDMVWVELPKGTGEDITGIKESKGLPETTIQETKQIPEEKGPTPPPPPPPPKVAEKKQPPKTEKDEMTEPSKKQKEAKETEKRVRYGDASMRNALAKIDKELKGRSAAPEAAQTGGGDGEGYKYGTGDKPLRLSRGDPEFLRYQAQVRAKIMRQWIVPGHYANMPGKTSPTARLHVTISASGSVLSTRWVRRSGDAAFDESATRAIMRASPFPVPPENLKWEALNEGFLVEFDIRRKRS